MRDHFKNILYARLDMNKDYERLKTTIDNLNEGDLNKIHDYFINLPSGIIIGDIKKKGNDLDLSVKGGITWIGINNIK
jgi:hypothetical protein